MKIALISDIHGNSIALDAVLADLESVDNIDAHWILGDHCAMGHDPVGVIERLQALPNLQCIRGNTDRWVTDSFDFFEGEISAESIPNRTAMSDTMSWTRGMVTAAGHFDWLAAMPLEWRTTLPDGTRVLCVHASPGTDEGAGFHPANSEADMLARVDSADTDLMLVGHTHWPMSQRFGTVHVVNASPVNLQSSPDFRAKYAILHANEDGYSVEFRYVEYDREQVIAALKTIHHPAVEYLAAIVRNGLNVFSASLEGDLMRLIPEAGKKHS